MARRLPESAAVGPVDAYLTEGLPLALLGLTWITIGRAMQIPAAREIAAPLLPAVKGA